MNGRLLIIFFFFFVHFIFAQYIVEGFIFDSINNKPIDNVSLVVFSHDEKILNYAYSTSNGSYKIEVNKAGRYNVLINKLGYSKQNEILNFTSTIKKDFRLTPERITEIKEVILTSSNPIKIKKDTIEIHAKAYIQGNENSLEDLLKKIPGLNIDSDGTVKVGDKEVEKIMIENDDFFEKGYRIVTKNMSANPIDKIQILEHYSNNKHLKGIENSDKVALNLTLKNEAKNQWFGTVYATNSFFPEKKYDAKINLMSFEKKNKFFFLANGNNIGFDATGAISHLVKPIEESITESIGNNVEIYNPLHISTSLINFSKNRSKFNNDKMLSTNAILNITNSLKLKFLAFYNYQVENNYKNTNIQYTTNDLSFNINQSDVLNSKKNDFFGKWELTYDRKKNQTFSYIGNFNYWNQIAKNSIALNAEPTLEELLRHKNSTNQNISFTHKFSDKKVLISSLRYISENLPNEYNLNTFIYQDLFPNQTNAESIQQTTFSSLNYLGFKVHYMIRDNKDNLFETSLLFDNSQQELNSIFKIISSGGSSFSDPLYKNKLKYRVSLLTLSNKYSLHLNDKLEVTPNLNISMVKNVLKSSFDERQEKLLFNPSIDFNWEAHKKGNISLNAFYNKSNADFSSIIPNYIQTDFRQFDKGIGKLTQLESYGGSILYNYGNWTDRFFFNSFINYTNFKDYFSDNSIISSNYTQSDEILIHNKRVLLTSSTFNYYLKKISTNLKLILSGSFSSYYNKVNNSPLRHINSLNYSYDVGFRSGWKKNFNYDLGFKWSETQIKVNSKSKLSNWNAYLDLIFSYKKILNIQINQELYNMENSRNSSSNYYFADIKAKYIFNDKINFNLNFSNIFNKRTFAFQSISDVSRIEINYSLLPRLVMLGTEVRF